eukprot:TRINITY_DN8550_c0_g1_i2.p1 TRINITY_DN8550_c0_g1~~TRINITY_DN8550_c0_g1_i2.p1  ORF type:complete len:102 (-),score=24.46 TRINITY_DN8550_c0_g1_i2:309-614(-)
MKDDYLFGMQKNKSGKRESINQVCSSGVDDCQDGGDQAQSVAEKFSGIYDSGSFLLLFHAEIRRETVISTSSSDAFCPYVMKQKNGFKAQAHIHIKKQQQQ